MKCPAGWVASPPLLGSQGPSFNPTRYRIQLMTSTLWVPKFRWHLSSAFFIISNYRLERHLYVKLKDWMSNSLDPDETAHWAVSSGSMLFTKAYYYCLWQWKSLSLLPLLHLNMTKIMLKGRKTSNHHVFLAMSKKCSWMTDSGDQDQCEHYDLNLEGLLKHT